MTSSTARIAPPSTDAKNRILKRVLERLAADWIALAEQAATDIPRELFWEYTSAAALGPQASVAERPIALSCHGSGKTRFLIGSPGTVRLATGTGKLSPIEKSSVAVSPPRRHKPSCRPGKLRHPTRSGSQSRYPSKVSKLYRHLEDFDAPLIDD
jgi:hypothetical protein